MVHVKEVKQVYEIVVWNQNFALFL